MELKSILDFDSFIPILKDPICSDYSKLPLSPYTWREACTQHRWGIMVAPTEQQKLNIMIMAGVLVSIKNAIYPIINPEIEIVSWLRFPQYNSFIGGARESMHLEALAVDFKVKGAKSYIIRERLKTQLTSLDIRMEILPETSEWIHVDKKKPENGVRYFKP